MFYNLVFLIELYTAIHLMRVQNYTKITNI